MSRGPNLTPVMSDLIRAMRANRGQVLRAPGGYWYPNHSCSPPAYGTSTVEALVKRGEAVYAEWKAGKHGAFPVRAALVGRPAPINRAQS